MYDVYRNKPTEIIDKNIPYITLSKKQISSSILKFIKIKNLGYKKFLTTHKKVLV